MVSDDDALLPFRRWEATPPGCLDVRVFDQHVHWIDALRNSHLISDRWDMTNSYLLEPIEFLVGRHRVRSHLDAHSPMSTRLSTGAVGSPCNSHSLTHMRRPSMSRSCCGARRKLATAAGCKPLVKSCGST